MKADLSHAVLALGGQATMAQLNDLGIDDRVVRWAVRSGELKRLTRGVYAVPSVVSDPVAEHSRRAQALLARCAGDLVLSHHSALVVAGLPAYGANLDVVALAVQAGRDRTWRRPGLHVHQLPVGVAVGGRSVAVPVAVAQVGVASGPQSLLVAGDAALRDLRCTAEDIAMAVELMTRVNGVAAARAAVPLLDGRRESPGESRLAWVLHLCRIPVEPQVTVRAGDRLYRTDFRVRGESVLIEFDGLVKYEDRTEIRRERRREADLIAAGWEVVRLQWPDLADPVRVAHLVSAGRRRAAGRGRWRP